MDLKVFCEDSSAHGLKKIVSAPSKVSKAFWSVVCVVAVIALLAHLYIRLVTTYHLITLYYFDTHNSRKMNDTIYIRHQLAARECTWVIWQFCHLLLSNNVQARLFNGFDC